MSVAPGIIEEVLHRYWGYTSFRPFQREAIDAVLARRDSLVVLPTGGGKSLCFQLPALLDEPVIAQGTSAPGTWAPGIAPGTSAPGTAPGSAPGTAPGTSALGTAPGTSAPGTAPGTSAPGTAPGTQHAARGTGLAVVISPLIALMKDQVDGLLTQGVPAACLHSGQTAAERRAALDLVRSGACRLLYVAPERAVGDTADGFRALVASRGVRYVAVDEAHCISHWGHDFRPEYRQLVGLREIFPGISLHAFTATATPRVQRDICAELRLSEPAVHIGSFDRPNLVYRVVPQAGARQQLETILRRHPGEAGIIYCLSRREVDTLAAALAAEGVRALPYHAGLDDGTRRRNQEAFLNDEIDVMVATVAFGMGIDRSDVRFVVHDGAPQSLEQYQQEAGRAGRDGLPAECVLISSPADFARWKSLLEKDGTWTESARALLRDMERYAASTNCRHRALVGYFGQQLPPGPCGACDWCLGELERVAEPLVLARKLLSAVARTGQRFGVGHVVSVLRGESSDAVLARGHQSLSVFGLLRDLSPAELRGYLDQLTQGAYLVRTGDQYPTLQLTAAGAELLRGRGEIVLFRQPKPARGRSRLPGARSDASWANVDQDLFERLRALRLDLARQRGVPPYVIFHDATLRELARLKPTTVEALYGVSGIGARKAEQYGQALLDVINEAR